MVGGAQSFDLFMKNGNSQSIPVVACLIDLELFVHTYVGIVLGSYGGIQKAAGIIIEIS